MACEKVVLGLNVICVVLTIDSRQAYILGIGFTLSALFVGVVTLDLEYVRTYSDANGYVPIWLQVLASTTPFGLAITAVSIPRRPPVYKGERPVDGGLTVPAIKRFTFTWCEPLLRLARMKKDLEYSDYPALDYHTRSADRSAAWKDRSASHSGLWRAFMGAYKGLFALQWILAIVQGATNFVPHWFTLKLLEVIEREIGDDHWSMTAWWLVLALALSLFIDGVRIIQWPQPS